MRRPSVAAQHTARTRPAVLIPPCSLDLPYPADKLRETSVRLASMPRERRHVQSPGQAPPRSQNASTIGE